MKTTAAFLMGTSAFLVSVSLAAAARPQHPSSTNAGSHSYTKKIVRSSRFATLYDQNSNDNGIAIVSQNFESSFDAYDSQGADDFTVPAGSKWILSEIDVTGQYFNGYGPAVSENVFIYKDKKGLPGKLVREFADLSGKDDAGSFVIKLPNVKLKPGHYWVSVQINMDFATGGEWGWEQSSVVQGDPAAWQNPGGGFGVCQTWTYEFLCFPPTGGRVLGGDGVDHMFTLKGKTKGG